MCHAKLMHLPGHPGPRQYIIACGPLQYSTPTVLFRARECDGCHTCYTACMNISTPSASVQVQAWLAKLPAQHEPVVAALRTLIFSAAPDAHETVYHDALGYGPADSGFDRILYISTFRAHVNLGFFYGGELHDPEGLLIGSGKRMRHIKLTSPQDCENPAIQTLLEEAWTVGLRHIAKRRGKSVQSR